MSYADTPKFCDEPREEEPAEETTPHTAVHYPMLNPSGFAPPVVQNTIAPPAQRQSDTEMHSAAPLRKPPTAQTPVVTSSVAETPTFWKKIISGKWFLKQAPKQSAPTGDGMWQQDVAISEDESLLPSPINPDYTIPTLLGMIEHRVSATELVKAGASVQTLTDNDITLDDLYQNGYGLRDVHTIVGEFGQLLKFGLTRQHIRGTWYLDQLCTLYDVDKAQLCRTLEFRAEDFVRTRVSPDEMSAMGINAHNFRTVLQGDFSTLYSMHIKFEDFADKFDLTLDSLKQLGLSDDQKYALSAHRGWTPFAIQHRFKLPVGDLNKVWFTLDFD